MDYHEKALRLLAQIKRREPRLSKTVEDIALALTRHRLRDALIMATQAKLRVYSRILMGDNSRYWAYTALEELENILEEWMRTEKK